MLKLPQDNLENIYDLGILGRHLKQIAYKKITGIKIKINWTVLKLGTSLIERHQ